MHDVPGVHWHEPTGDQRAGKSDFAKPPTVYDSFMMSEGIPIFRDYGFRTLYDLPLEPWERTGGRGSFIQLYGTETKWGSHALEVPAKGQTNVQRHLYEQIYLVVEGRGTTEVWMDDEAQRHVFEWQTGSLFSIPINCHYRIVNATGRPALMFGGNTAPNVMNALGDSDIVFNSDYRFSNRFTEDADFYKYNEDIEPDPIRGLAMRRTNIVPDLVHCDLPLDNRRSPGARRLEPFMTDNTFYLWCAQHETGRYSKAHAHTSAAVLICLTGAGYTYSWPEECGVTPWKDGHEDKISRVDYEFSGMVSAAPGGARWFHQHFNASKEPFRLTAWFGPNHPSLEPGPPGEKQIDYTGMDITEGGTSIPYWMEDPYIRGEFEGTLSQNGGKSRMEDDLYIDPEISGIKRDTRYIG